MSRQANIRKRPDGLFEARITLPRGKRISFYGKTQAEARRKMEEAKSLTARGLPLIDERQTVREYLTSWLETITVRPSTWQRYKELVAHMLPMLGDLPLARLQPQQVKQLYAKKKQEVSEAMAHHIHAVLHKALEDAVRDGIVPYNVTDRLEPPKMPHREMAALSPDDALTFLEAARGNRLEALYVLALTSGMREGELLALKWADVFLEADKPYLHVRATLHYLQGRFTFDPPKSKRGERDILLHPLAIEALKAHRTRQKAEKLKAAQWDDFEAYRDLVFPNHVGRPIECGNFLKRSYYFILLEKAKLPRVTFHSLRHSAASFMLNEGTPTMTVSRMLGHSTAAFTMDRYGHVGLEDQEVAITKMSRALRQRGRNGVKEEVI